jgi:hypothetical protein
MADRYEELEKLHKLRESGAVTDEVFQVEKRRSVDPWDDRQHPDRSFEVQYSGARSFSEKWVKKGDVYRLKSGETKMPQC